MKEQVSWALKNLATDDDNKARIMEEGVMPSFCDLMALWDGDEETTFPPHSADDMGTGGATNRQGGGGSGGGSQSDRKAELTKLSEQVVWAVKNLSTLDTNKDFIGEAHSTTIAAACCYSHCALALSLCPLLTNTTTVSLSAFLSLSHQTLTSKPASTRMP